MLGSSRFRLVAPAYDAYIVASQPEFALTIDAREREACSEAVADLALCILRTLAMLELCSRHLHPPALDQLAEQIAPVATELSAAGERFARVDWPEPLQGLRDRLLEAATLAGGACAGLSLDGPEDLPAAFRALRRSSRALEVLYPVATILPPVSRFFLERELDEACALALVRRCAEVAEAPRPDRGLFHAGNDIGERGGWSVYVPEWVPDDRPMPLVVALHGGSGHGRDFLQIWLREARTRGCVLVAPTSPAHTWSFTGGEDTDAARLFELVEQLRSRLSIDATRMLLTGMSDGGTYSLLTGLRADAPFTALAPFSCVLSPEVVADGRILRARDLPIRIVHGALDWMFPLSMAQEGVRLLEEAGSRVEFVELDDLSHTYAREEHAKVLDWMDVGVPSIDQIV